MGLGFAYLEGTEVKWRIFLGLQLLCAIFMLAGSFWMPESPRWLVANGKHEEAHGVLKRLHAPTKKQQAAAIDQEAETSEDEVPLYKREFHQIEAQIAHEREIEHLGVGAIRDPATANDSTSFSSSSFSNRLPPSYLFRTIRQSSTEHLG